MTTVLPMYVLQRHPLTVQAHFAYSLVLTFAFPREILERMLPPGLKLDTFDDFGFVAIAMVQTQRLRPTVLPEMLAQSFFLAGYRIFTTFKSRGGMTVRGLYILRSDTNRRLMATAGNLLTHYKYQVSKVETSSTKELLTCHISTRNQQADLKVTADLAGNEELPSSSPFHTLREARRFAGPLPYTFDHETQTKSIIVIKGDRKNWHPRVVPVKIHELTFFDSSTFESTPPQLASAFYVENIDYQWNPGVRHRLGEK